MLVEEDVMSTFIIRRSSKGYRLLCLAVQEAAELYPDFPTFDVFCRKYLTSAQEKSVQTVQRTLARAVNALWEQEENQGLFNRYYGYQVVEKPSAKDFVYTLGGYISRRNKEAANSTVRYVLPGLVKLFIDPVFYGRPCLVIPLDSLLQVNEIVLREEGEDMV